MKVGKLSLTELGKVLPRLKQGSQTLARVPSSTKNRVLLSAAERLLKAQGEILAANAKDLKALPKSTPAAYRDRLELDPGRLAAMAASLRAVAELPDPVGEVVEERRLTNGLRLKRVRGPFGVILLVFESRPNVVTEAFALAFKSGNAIILRGGSESLRTVTVLYDVLEAALAEAKLTDCLWGLTQMDRAWVARLLKARRYIDLVVPRGGEGLIRSVEKGTRIPVIKNDRGLCHAYVSADADFEMALNVVRNAKVQRPGVCNSLETVLVDATIAPGYLPVLHSRMELDEVEWFCCPKAFALLKGLPKVKRAAARSFDTEYLALKINCKVVEGLDEALAHIAEHGSRHSETILTQSEPLAREFQAQVDAAAVYWNASTRFTDGFEFGLGGELGISTQKLHVRGPVGLRELTIPRWIGDGTGQVRG